MNNEISRTYEELSVNDLKEEYILLPDCLYIFMYGNLYFAGHMRSSETWLCIWFCVRGNWNIDSDIHILEARQI